MTLTLLLGGARSGKSALAVEIGHRHGAPVTYVATAPRLDDDMAQRIARHRNERPAQWATVEEQTELADALDRCGSDLVIIDCLTLWTSNLMWGGLADDEILRRAGTLAHRCADRVDPVVAISNEVGLGVHPDTELGRRYRDVLGRVNQAFADVADPSLLLVAGRALRLEDPWNHLAVGDLANPTGRRQTLGP